MTCLIADMRKAKGIHKLEYLVTGKEMKLLDQNTSEYFKVPAEVLMEQAAGSFVRELFSLKKDMKRVLVVCGMGNNGADGIAAARLLNQAGVFASVFSVGQTQGESKLHKLQMEIYRAYQMPQTSEISEDYDLIVDAVFGTGLSRSITGEIQTVLEAINECQNPYKVALDIASGISADTGEVLGTAFLADATITFSFAKIGQLFSPGYEYSGRLVVAPIGITKETFLDKKPKYAALTKEDLLSLPERKANSNKGTYGKLLVIAGSEDMAGAAFFAAKSAYAAGCGIVKILTSENNRTILLDRLPEAIVAAYGKNPDQKRVIEEINWADAIVVGPGIGSSDSAKELLSLVMNNTSVPVVFDADALNLLSKDVDKLLRPHVDYILTPHLGEMARLTGNAISYIKANLLETAQDFAAQYNVTCVLKDFHTVTAVPYGVSYVNLSGNNGMATAGSGDVLAGIIGSLLAQGLPAERAASLGVYIHGVSGDLAREKQGVIALMAEDIIDGLKMLSLKLDK